MPSAAMIAACAARRPTAQSRLTGRVKTVSITEGYAPYGPYQTWYRVTGDLKSGKPPLIVAHGGPGCTHDYVDSFKDIAETGRAVVHYDQVGNGRSTHLPEKGGDFWTVPFFKAETDNLVDHLGIRDGFCLANPGAGCWARNMRWTSLRA